MIFIISLASFILVAFAQQCTEPNQKYNTCGSVCEPSCKDPNPSECTKQCFKGCFCESGYVKDDQGNCILQKDCPAVSSTTEGPPQCEKPNQRFSACGSGCQPTCRKPNPQTCPPICVMGCFCQSGFVLDDKENCIRQSDCP